MYSTTLTLLPGLDGTGRLFDRLRLALTEREAGVSAKAVAFPADTPMTYVELADRLAANGLPSGRLVLIAESFSGPLALLLASRMPNRVAGVVLAASFVKSPLLAASETLAKLIGPWAFGTNFIRPAVRPLLVGWSAPTALVDDVCHAVESVKPEVLVARLREVLTVDVSSLLLECRAPLLYIHATRDRLLRRRALGDLKGVRPTVRIHTIDAPHLVLQAAPMEGAEAIVEFVTSLGLDPTVLL